MRTGQKIVVRQNFSGRLLESYIVPTDRDISVQNEKLIRSFWSDNFGGVKQELTKKGWIYRDVPVETVEDFLTRFRAHDLYSDRKADIVTYLRTLAEAHPVADVLMISTGKGAETLAPFELGTQERVVGTLLDGGAWQLNKDRVASRGDEQLGLSDTQIAKAGLLASEDEKSKSKNPSDTHFREMRNKPLLMIHSLQPHGNEAVTGPIPAFGVSFPPGHYETEIEVVANRVWMDRMHGSFDDDPDDEDDYDE